MKIIDPATHMLLLSKKTAVQVIMKQSVNFTNQLTTKADLTLKSTWLRKVQVEYIPNQKWLSEWQGAINHTNKCLRLDKIFTDVRGKLLLVSNNDNYKNSNKQEIKCPEKIIKLNNVEETVLLDSGCQINVMLELWYNNNKIDEEV